MTGWRQRCAACGRLWPLEMSRWCCSCSGLLDLVGPLTDPVGSDAASPLERYRDCLPPLAPGVDLGLAVTPLEPAGDQRWIKADYRHPTGSFKDRGAAVMIGAAARAGTGSIVVDSSGNAGRSAAAHAAAVGLACTVYLPQSTPPAKVAAMARYGAGTVMVGGPRAAAAVAAQQAAVAGGHWYASHAHRPSFHHGVKTLAYELYEQSLGRFDLAGAAIVVPAGNGTLVLGCWIGFGELVALGRLARRPRIVAVQAERCAPLTGRPAPPGGRPSAAAGIAIAAPPRLGQVRAAVTSSGGRVVTVSEDEIAAAITQLAGLGHVVEPTGAVAWAALDGRSGPGPRVAVLSG